MGKDSPGYEVFEDTMHFIDELTWRGLIQDTSDLEGLKKLSAGATFYTGVDPTAPSLQIGNLIPLMVSLHLGRAGLNPIVLFGGATGSIGDPSGRSQERKLLEQEVVDSNVRKQIGQVEKIFSRFDVRPTFVNNLDWTKGVSMLDFLRDVGKFFTVNYMLAKEVVKTRLAEEGISYTEFSYMLLQANDFLHLYNTKKCVLQIGGSDQWGNITAGLELIRKKIQGDAYAFSWPLLLNAQGKKFGKSESGTLWLDPSLTSPYKFHQFWLNAEDKDAIRLLKIFTFLSQEEIAVLAEKQKTAPEKREAQHLLADTVCTYIHGEKATEDAKRSAKVLFGGSIEGLTESQLEDIFSDVPSVTLSRDKLKAGTVLDLFVDAGAVKSKGEARRLIQNGGAYLDNERVAEDDSFYMATVEAKKLVVLRTGKKNYFLVKIA